MIFWFIIRSGESSRIRQMSCGRPVLRFVQTSVAPHQNLLYEQYMVWFYSYGPIRYSILKNNEQTVFYCYLVECIFPLSHLISVRRELCTSFPLITKSLSTHNWKRLSHCPCAERERCRCQLNNNNIEYFSIYGRHAQDKIKFLQGSCPGYEDDRIRMG